MEKIYQGFLLLLSFFFFLKGIDLNEKRDSLDRMRVFSLCFFFLSVFFSLEYSHHGIHPFLFSIASLCLLLNTVHVATYVWLVDDINEEH